ncbi:hypothetical protein BCR33DRAFT_715519 [Rhizoclosmatium globosum]|uniref:Uncharacterized protein n=1 Tax=Rhizoclosmatium globosum TaxID=329046 RepID=A0A1Y2CJF6_9FUNG|nr:hypothetical protein BCR33DRAFT_715519 [Rhizoclosmatium globosum]|eukprot:ORY46435.1 hypothetical protein BCR33DRAFT_715519 [Rhizoclosmatium globosum]
MVRVSNRNNQSSISFGDDTPLPTSNRNRPMSPMSPPASSVGSHVLSSEFNRSTSPTPSQSASAIGRRSNSDLDAAQPGRRVSEREPPPRPGSTGAAAAANNGYERGGYEQRGYERSGNVGDWARSSIPLPTDHHNTRSNTSNEPAVSPALINAQTAKFEALFEQMQAKLDVQNELIQDMFAYIRRIDGDVGALSTDVNAIKNRMDRLRL